MVSHGPRNISGPGVFVIGPPRPELQCKIGMETVKTSTKNILSVNFDEFLGKLVKFR